MGTDKQLEVEISKSNSNWKKAIDYFVIHKKSWNICAGR